jgi:hypothetical protein
MRLVSENSDDDIRREHARQDIVWPLKELAANLIRVVRGAGKPYEIASQADRVLDAFEAYREVVGHYPPSDEIQNAVSIRFHDHDRESSEIDWAISQIVQGSLQIAASRIVGQSTQEAAGERETLEGVNALERARQARREKWESDL